MKRKNLLRITLIGIITAGLFTACPKPEEISGLLKTLKTLVIPANKESIEDGEYANKGYTSVRFEDGSKIAFIPKDAFKGNKIKVLILPDSIVVIAKGAFEDNPIDDLTLSEALTTIGDNAFKGNNLQEVIFTDEIDNIGKDAFTRKENIDRTEKKYSKTLPTFKVLSKEAMNKIFAAFTITKNGNKQLPKVESAAQQDNKELDELIKSTEENVINDTSGPTVSGAPVIKSIPTDNEEYKVGEDIKVAVNFNEPVYVSGTPQIILTIGEKRIPANYNRALSDNEPSGDKKGKQLIFVYTVDGQAGDGDSDGIEVKENALKLNEGTIKDEAGNSAIITHSACATQANHKVAAVLRITNIEIADLKNGNKYKENDVVKVTVTFNRDAELNKSTDAHDDNTNRPHLDACSGDTRARNVGNTIGWCDNIGMYYSGYGNSGSNKTEWIFEYRIHKNDHRIQINYKILLNGNTIKGESGDDTFLSYKSEDGRTHNIFGVQYYPKKGPTVEKITAEPAKDKKFYHKSSEDIIVRVEFSTSVQVDKKDPPQLYLRLEKDRGGFEGVWVNFKEKDKNDKDGKTLLFMYEKGTIKLADHDDGFTAIYIFNDYLKLPSTISIMDSENRSAFTKIQPVKISSDGTIKKLTEEQVKATFIEKGFPKIKNLEIKTCENEDSKGRCFYGKGDFIKVTMTLSQKVRFSHKSSHRMYINMIIGENTVQLKGGKSVLRNDEDTIEFWYRVAKGDNDVDGISIPAGKLVLAGNVIVSEINDLNLDLYHNGINRGNPLRKHQVDSEPPTVKSAKFQDLNRRRRGQTYGSVPNHFIEYPSGSGNWMDLIRFPRKYTPYKEGDKIRIETTFTEKVKMYSSDKKICEGKPYLTLMVGTNKGHACAEGFGTAAAGDDGFFEKYYWVYKVQKGDTDTDGVMLKRLQFSRLRQIRDQAGNYDSNSRFGWERFSTIPNREAALLTKTSIFRRVDTTPPKIEKIVMRHKKNQPYSVGDSIDVKVVFNEPVRLVDTDNKNAYLWGMYMNPEPRKLRKEDVHLLLSIGESDEQKAQLHTTFSKHVKMKTKEKFRRQDFYLFHEMIFRHTVTPDNISGKIIITKDALKLGNDVVIMDIAGNTALVNDLKNDKQTTTAKVLINNN